MTTKEKIMKTIDEIPEARYCELFELVEDFKKKTGDNEAKGKWARFAGILTDEEAEIILTTVEEEFEKQIHEHSN